MINPTEDNPITIHLAAGTYSPETGESFPINLNLHIFLDGEDKENTILDAMRTNGVIELRGGDSSEIDFGCRPEVPNISNITITGGLESGGAGIHISSFTEDEEIIITDVIINDNIAYGGDGGGIYISSYFTTIILTDVIISENIVGADRGGWGGGLFIEGSHPILNSVTIENNISNYSGGGIALVDCDNANLSHVNIYGNTSIQGGGMTLSHSNPTLTNSIIWGNSPESIYIYSATPLITYSDIEGGWEGEGNIDIDPLFVNPENGDYTLMEGSPCIDAGTADLDGDGVDDTTDFIGSAPDMGVYEFGESSEIMPGDTNFDGIVDILDIVQIVNYILRF
jgi:hypothetical protein